LIDLKSLNPDIKTIVPFTLSAPTSMLLFSTTWTIMTLKSERCNSLYPGFYNESVFLIDLKSLNPALKTIVPFTLSAAALMLLLPTSWNIMTIKSERYNSLYLVFNDESVLVIDFV